jgi:ribosomal protein L16/L10AE
LYRIGTRSAFDKDRIKTEAVMAAEMMAEKYVSIKFKIKVWIFTHDHVHF